MSENLPKNNTNEEVDLGILFSAIGNFFSNIISFFQSIYKSIFSAIVFLIKTIIKNFKFISIVLLLALITGLILDNSKEDIFYSEMLVKPYFRSNYQLISNINYYNSLLESENFEKLESIFKITPEEVRTIRSFKIDKGFKTENELLQDFVKYTKTIDSINAKNITFDNYVKNRNLYSSDTYSITVKSSKRDLFNKLSYGFISTFNNEYSKKLMRVRDSTIAIKKATFLRDLKKIDSLQMVYLDILKQESKNGAASIGFEGLLPLTQERTKTREYELFQNEVSIRDSIRVLDELKIEESVYYDIITDFSDIGLKSKELTDQYYILLPLLALFIMFITYMSSKVIKFVGTYEG